jgi:hypothetical protein
LRLKENKKKRSTTALGILRRGFFFLNLSAGFLIQFRCKQ